MKAIKTMKVQEPKTTSLAKNLLAVPELVRGKFTWVPDVERRHFVWLNPKPKKGSGKTTNFYYYDDTDYSQLNTMLNNLYLVQGQHEQLLEDAKRDYNFDLTHESAEFKEKFGADMKRLKVLLDGFSNELREKMKTEEMSMFSIFQFWFDKIPELTPQFEEMLKKPLGNSVFNYTIATQFAYFTAKFCDPFKTIDDFRDLAQYLNTLLNPNEGFARQRSLRAVVRGRDWKPVGVEEIYDSVKALGAWCATSDGEIGPIEKAVVLHTELIRIQPFSDGNHRTARLLANTYLMHYGLPPIHITNDAQRSVYDLATDRAIETHNLDELTMFIHRNVTNGSKLLDRVCKKAEAKTK